MGSAATFKRLAALVATIATVLTSLVLAGTGATATTPAATCPGAIEYPFTPFGDSNAYVLAPGGSFEGATDWTFTGGASVVSGNEPFHIHAASDSKSLSIPAGGSATSGAICVTKLDPTIRFVATGGSASSALQVEVFATKPNASVKAKETATIPASPSWAPSPAVKFHANAFANGLGGTTTAWFRFTPLGNAGWKIDDLYLDPRKGG